MAVFGPRPSRISRPPTYIFFFAQTTKSNFRKIVFPIRSGTRGDKTLDASNRSAQMLYNVYHSYHYHHECKYRQNQGRAKEFLRVYRRETPSVPFRHGAGCLHRIRQGRREDHWRPERVRVLQLPGDTVRGAARRGSEVPRPQVREIMAGGIGLHAGTERVPFQGLLPAAPDRRERRLSVLERLHASGTRRYRFHFSAPREIRPGTGLSNFMPLPGLYNILKMLFQDQWVFLPVRL